jgi:hypothetical protein
MHFEFKYNLSRFAPILICILPLASAQPSYAVTKPGDPEFCSTFMDSIKWIVDDFGIDVMKKGSNEQTFARISGVLIDSNFAPRFGVKLADVPPPEQAAWRKAMELCARSDLFRSSDDLYRRMIGRLSLVVGYIFQPRNHPLRTYYLSAVEGYGQAARVLAEPVHSIEPTLAAYLAALDQHRKTIDDIAVVRPSKRAEVVERLSAARRTAVEAAIAAQSQRANGEASVAYVAAVMPPAIDAQTVDAMPASERALLARLLEARIAQAQSAIDAVLKSAPNDEARVRLSAELLKLVPQEPRRTRRSQQKEPVVQEAVPNGHAEMRAKLELSRRQAFDAFASQLTQEIKVTKELAAVATLQTRFTDVYDRRLDDRSISASALVDALRQKRAELAEAAYRKACDSYLADLKIDADDAKQLVLGPRGTVELWQLVCGMRDQGHKVASFSAPGFFSSIYELKATSRQGDVITIRMKEAEAANAKKALVGVELVDAVETKPFTLESWKSFTASHLRR